MPLTFLKAESVPVFPLKAAELPFCGRKGDLGPLLALSFLVVLFWGLWVGCYR